MSARITPIELVGLARRFGRHAVLRQVDLTLAAGEIVGLMGANGSGKTTLFSILSGLLAPDKGELRFGEVATEDVSMAIRTRLAYVAHAPQIYPLLTARENVELFADLRRAVGAPSAPAAPMLERMGLGAVIDRPVGTFSRGMAQRVVLARALAGSPDALLLDEPFTALDRDGREMLADILREERERGTAILLSSHDVDSVVSVADRVLLLEDGVIASDVARTEAEAYRSAVSALQHRKSNVDREPGTAAPVGASGLGW